MDNPSQVASNINNNANTNNNKSTTIKGNKKTTDSQLKGSIIEFMRERPFLWDSKHPSYKDYKRRDHEFQLFSKQIDCSVQEIKRVWHVLRTNFFRAHKLLLDKPQTSDRENGEKLWKYYLAMDYILKGTILKTEPKPNKDPDSLNSSSTSIINSTISNNNGTISDNNSTISNNNSSTSTNIKTTLLSDLSLDTDDDHLYARSLTSTLKKFDPTTKEIIKLKFQEIIVNYMQIQQQSDVLKIELK